MHDLTNNNAPSRISQSFIRSEQIHSHYTRFSAAGNFHVQRSGLNQLLLSFSKTGARIWNKIYASKVTQAKESTLQAQFT